MTTAIPVSVVVPVYNGARTIAACIEAIGRQDFGGERELVVVDNGSTDDTRAIVLRYDFARLVTCATPGPAAARNAGIAATHHELIAFTDADCIPAPGWLSAMVACWEPALAGIGGRLESANHGPVEEVVAAISFGQEETMGAAMGYVITANSLFSRAALAASGGFDESFPIAGGEDNDLSWRLRAAGGRFGYADDALVQHNHPVRLMDLFSQRMRYGYALTLLWAKYRDTAQGVPLAGALPNWGYLCVCLARRSAAARVEHRLLHDFAHIAYYAGWIVGGGVRDEIAARGRNRRPWRERLIIAAMSPLAAIGCVGVIGAMLVSGRYRRVFRHLSAGKAMPS